MNVFGKLALAAVCGIAAIGMALPAQAHGYFHGGYGHGGYYHGGGWRGDGWYRSGYGVSVGVGPVWYGGGYGYAGPVYYSQPVYAPAPVYYPAPRCYYDDYGAYRCPAYYPGYAGPAVGVSYYYGNWRGRWHHGGWYRGHWYR
ncbi:MAG: hypothetical protein JSR26_09960 [Proteobacteria bacterium]|nr:hypothetical protein [Pseudomonadota bacterium]